MVREELDRVRRVAAWLAVMVAAALLAGCQSPYQMHYEGDDFPPGQYAPSGREQTARNIVLGVLDALLGGGDDD